MGKLNLKARFKDRKTWGTVIGIAIYVLCIIFLTYAFYTWRSKETEVVIGINDSAAEVEFENDGLVNATNIGPVLNYEDGASGGFKATNGLNRTIEINIRLRLLSISDNLVNEDFKYILLKSEDGGANYDIKVASGDFTSLQVGLNLLARDTIPARAVYSYKLYVYIDGSVKNDTNLQDNSMMSVLSIRDYTELSEIAAGSYVAYTGNNGCEGDACNGQNANYVDDEDMGYCSNSNSKFTVNGWRVAYTKGGAAYIVSAGAPECVGPVYVESKSTDTETLNYYDPLTYLVSNTATYDSDTSSYVLGTTSTYTYPKDINSLKNKYTCGDTSTTSCNDIYKIVVDSDANVVWLKKLTTSTCITSTNSSDSNYRNCKIRSSYDSYWYFDSDFVMKASGFQLTNPSSTGSTVISEKYTCKSKYSTEYCDTLYYIIGDKHVPDASSGNHDEYASYIAYSFNDYEIIGIYVDSYLNGSYLCGSDYEFDLINGGYTLKDTSILDWDDDYQNIISTNKYTCLSDSDSCTTMYEITSDSTSSQAVYYEYTSTIVDSDTFINRLNEEAKKYCHGGYSYLGKCDSNSVWAMNGDDFSKMTTSTLSSCNGSTTTACGNDNNLIKNGGIYWYGTKYSSSYPYYFNSTIKRDKDTSNSFGLRPVIRLDADIVVTGGSGTYEVPYQFGKMKGTTTVVEYVQNLYNDGSKITAVNIGGNTGNPEVNLNTTQGIMLDNNGDYRYYGANPNNYVSYNGELWRIISVGNVKASAIDTVGETRAKIIKNSILLDDNGLSKYSWDSSASDVNSGSGVGDWSQADLMTELNTLYFNSDSGICYIESNNSSTACNFTNTGLSEEAKKLTSDALYYLGGSKTHLGLYADDWYTIERGTTVWGATSGQTCNDDACPRATTWTGRIGIIYPSDYAYATDLSVCTESLNNYAEDICKSNNWFVRGYGNDMTITPNLFNTGSSVYVIAWSGSFGTGNGGVKNAAGVRPVQYLRSGVKIVAGKGSSENPYILGI